jgi:biofilm PGA synthesis protein PgaA
MRLAAVSFATSFATYAVLADAQSGQKSEPAYQAGIAAYRAGRTEQSYTLLRQVYLSEPANSRFRNDFIVAAVAAGHEEEALAIAQPLDVNQLPVYVLESLGRAARDRRQPDLAIKYYDVILTTRDDIGAQVGRDLALLDRGNVKEAQTSLVALNREYPNRIDVLEALGLADEALGQNIDALACAEAILKQEPTHVGALKLRYRMLVASGAPQLALATTPKDLIGADQQRSALRDELAFDFRWARDEPSDDLTRAKNLDAVIVRMQAAIAAESSDPAQQSGIRGDLIEALAERGRNQEAVDEYLRLKADNVTPEPYVIGAVAAAYVGLHQPDTAASLFETLKDRDAASYGARASYFYALLESGRYDEAVAWADHLAASEPTYSYANFPELRTANDNYSKALILSGLARTFTDRLADGQARLGAVDDAAPANQDARIALALTYELRGWPRQAAAETRSVLEDDPDATSPLSQLFADQLDMADWRGADATLARMRAVLPANDSELARADRNWDTHQMPEVTVDGRLGQSHGGRSGVIDSEIDEYVYSSPIDWDYRLYVHLNQAEGDPEQGHTYRHAVGAGLEYHTTDWLATAEMIEIDDSSPHPEFSLAWTPDDHWKIGGSYGIHTLDLPIAALVVGVHADKLAFDVDYRVSESRDFGAQVSGENFSDDNQRRELDGFWRERWITGPSYKFDTRLDLGTSENTLNNTNYFNPRRDYSAVVTAENQWLQYRRYDTSLSHEVDFGVGPYWERNYGDGLIAVVRYQLVYEVNDRLTLKAGVSRGLHPYDGVSERLDEVLFSLDGRF